MSDKPEPMTPEAFRELLGRNKLRQADAAWICGVHIRQARAWAIGEYPVPQYARLLLLAYDEGKLSASWLAKHIETPVPA